MPILYIDFCTVAAGPAGAGHEDPVVVAAILLPERSVLAHTTTWRVPDARDAAVVLADALERSDGRPVALPRLDGPAARALSAVLEADQGGPSPDDGFAPSRRFRPAAGETLGSLELRPGRTMRPRSAGPPPRPVRKAVAAVVAEAVAEHNAAHPIPTRRTSEPEAGRSSHLLRWVAAMPD